MELNTIYNENCISTLERMENNNGFDFIITSPPYNTNVKANAKNNTLTINVKENQYTYARYDGYDDSRTNEEYCDFIANLFKMIKLKMRPNGCVLWNASYGNGFLHFVDCDNAVKAFIKANKDYFAINWKARNYKEFKHILDFITEHTYFPDDQRLFYSVVTKFYIANLKVEKKRAGFGHCRFTIKLDWPFVIYYRRIADVVLDDEIKSSEFAKSENAKNNEIYCKEYPFEKEFVFEYAQCGKTPKWIINEIYLKFIRSRFCAITEKMNNPPKSVEEFRRDLDGI